MAEKSGKVYAFGRTVGPEGSQEAIVGDTPGNDQFGFERSLSLPVDEMPYWQQGDKGMYTEEALRMRKELKKSRRIKSEIQQFWNVLPKNKDGCITKKEYLKLVTRVSKVLIAGITDKEALKVAREEWANDSHGKEVMSFQLFFDAIFQLTDLWTVAIDPQEYSRFVRVLMRRVTVKTVTNSDGTVEVKMPYTSVKKSMNALRVRESGEGEAEEGYISDDNDKKAVVTYALAPLGDIGAASGDEDDDHDSEPEPELPAGVEAEPTEGEEGEDAEATGEAGESGVDDKKPTEAATSESEVDKKAPKEKAAKPTEEDKKAAATAKKKTEESAKNTEQSEDGTAKKGGKKAEEAAKKGDKKVEEAAKKGDKKAEEAAKKGDKKAEEAGKADAGKKGSPAKGEGEARVTSPAPATGDTPPPGDGEAESTTEGDAQHREENVEGEVIEQRR